MMASLSPEQREQLAQLMSQALADVDLASEMAQLADNLRTLVRLQREEWSLLAENGEDYRPYQVYRLE